MKRGGQDRQLHRSLSNTTAFRGIHRPPERQRPSQFTRKWNVAEERADMAAPFLEVEEQPLKTIEDVLTCPCPRSGDKGETSGSDGWSALSDDPEDHKEDTAYGGSSFGSRKKGSDEHFHRKYKPSSPTFSPPVSQCIEPHTTTEMRPCTPTDPTAAECTSQPVQDSEDWWRPNLFKGFMGMICNAGWIEEEVASSLDGEKEEDEEDSIAMHDRVLRRLVHRKMTAHIQRPSPPRLPARARLHLRMQQAKRFQDAKSEEIHCALEHPFDIKEMIPNGTESPHPLAPPEIRVIEYLPPTSVTDLSDFECYMGCVFVCRCAQACDACCYDVCVLQACALCICQRWQLSSSSASTCRALSKLAVGEAALFLGGTTSAIVTAPKRQPNRSLIWQESQILLITCVLDLFVVLFQICDAIHDLLDVRPLQDEQQPNNNQDSL